MICELIDGKIQTINIHKNKNPENNFFVFLVSNYYSIITQSLCSKPITLSVMKYWNYSTYAVQILNIVPANTDISPLAPC